MPYSMEDAGVPSTRVLGESEPMDIVTATTDHVIALAAAGDSARHVLQGNDSEAALPDRGWNASALPGLLTRTGAKLSVEAVCTLGRDLRLMQGVHRQLMGQHATSKQDAGYRGCAATAAPAQMAAPDDVRRTEDALLLPAIRENQPHDLLILRQGVWKRARMHDLLTQLRAQQEAKIAALQQESTTKILHPEGQPTELAASVAAPQGIGRTVQSPLFRIQEENAEFDAVMEGTDEHAARSTELQAKLMAGTDGCNGAKMCDTVEAAQEAGQARVINKVLQQVEDMSEELEQTKALLEQSRARADACIGALRNTFTQIVAQKEQTESDLRSSRLALQAYKDETEAGTAERDARMAELEETMASLRRDKKRLEEELAAAPRALQPLLAGDRLSEAAPVQALSSSLTPGQQLEIEYSGSGATERQIVSVGCENRELPVDAAAVCNSMQRVKVWVESGYAGSHPAAPVSSSVTRTPSTTMAQWMLDKEELEKRVLQAQARAAASQEVADACIRELEGFWHGISAFLSLPVRPASPSLPTPTKLFARDSQSDCLDSPPGHRHSAAHDSAQARLQLEQRWACHFDCGFAGSFDDVARHESVCFLRGQAPPSSPAPPSISSCTPAPPSISDKDKERQSEAAEVASEHSLFASSASTALASPRRRPDAAPALAEDKPATNGSPARTPSVGAADWHHHLVQDMLTLLDGEAHDSWRSRQSRKCGRRFYYHAPSGMALWSLPSIEDKAQARLFQAHKLAQTCEELRQETGREWSGRSVLQLLESARWCQHRALAMGLASCCS